MEVNFRDVLDIYEKEVRVNTKNKRKVLLFEKNKMQNINRIVNDLRSANYIPGKYNVFVVFEPKCRIVMSLNIRDKIINHYMARYVLIPKLTKYLDIRNVATRSGMGISYADNLIKKYLNSFNEEFYVLKLDIKKYFYNIDHDILLSMLKDKINEEEYSIIHNIISTTNSEYINIEIERLKNKCKTSRKDSLMEMPYYNPNKGLSLGAMVSQFLSIYYLNELDHYIVHDLRIKKYVRYMDDLVLIHSSKEVLKSAKKEIEEKLRNNYKLELNEKKSRIYSKKDSFIFLGKRYKTVGNKLIIKNTRGKKRRKDIINIYKNYKKGYVTSSSIFSSYNSLISNGSYEVEREIKNILS